MGRQVIKAKTPYRSGSRRVVRNEMLDAAIARTHKRLREANPHRLVVAGRRLATGLLIPAPPEAAGK